MIIIIDEIEIGNYIVRNVITGVANDNNISLLGVSFLNKFSNVEWNMKKNELKLIK